MSDLKYEERKTTEGPEISGCSEGHACHEAKAEIEVTEEVMKRALEILSFYDPYDREENKVIIRELFSLLPRT